jgi:hypothetical protein
MTLQFIQALQVQHSVARDDTTVYHTAKAETIFPLFITLSIESLLQMEVTEF